MLNNEQLTNEVMALRNQIECLKSEKNLIMQRLAELEYFIEKIATSQDKTE